MSSQTFESRLRLGATIIGILVSLEMVRYTYHSFRRAYRFCFGEPERWTTHWMVDAGAQIEQSQRLALFLLWGAVILASIAVFIAAIRLLFSLRSGRIFTSKSARLIQWIGGLLVFTAALDTVFMAFEAYIITLNNADGPNPIAYLYDPTDLKSATMGAILFLFGGVMHKATEIEQENHEFV